MSKIVHITHFIDPHCFYFKFDDDLHDPQLQSLEDEITKFARNKETESNVTFNVGDTVAAYQIAWGKWVRAEVRANLTEFERCHLWAIDHGKHFQTTYKNIIALPQHLIDMVTKGVHRGSIYGANPGRLDFNYNTFQADFMPCENWSEKALDECNRLLFGNDVLKVLYDIKEQRRNHVFGDLVAESLPKKRASVSIVNIGEALVAIDEALEVDFQKEMVRIALKYETTHDNYLMQSETESESGSLPTVIHNGVNIRQKLSAVRGKIQPPEPLNPVSNGAASRAPSTVIPSEINGGATRMKRFNRLRNPAPSIAPSTVIPSEINGGATRMNANHNRGFNIRGLNKNGKAHMPAGFERDTHSFDKHNNRH